MLEPAIGSCAIEALTPLSGGLVNSNVRVQLAGGAEPLVLRVYVREPAACAREAALYRLVAGRVPTPRLLHADPSGARAPWPYAVLSWIEGVSPAEAVAAGPAGDAGRALGVTLAALQTFRFQQAGFFTPELTLESELEAPRGWLDHIQAQLFAGGGAQRLGEPLADEVWTFVQENVRYLPGPDDPVVLCHGDYKQSNVLLRRDEAGWAVAGLLDWEYAFAGPPFFDLAALLRYAHQLPPGFEHGVAAGYREAGGALPVCWKRRVKLPDFANFADFLALAEHGGTVVQDVRELIQRTLREWPSYPE